MRKNLIISFCSVMLLTVSVTAFANEPEKPMKPSKTCKWEEQSCGFLEGSREICVVTGNGFECDCGDVTREC